jgi:hypothetical protein
MIEVFLLFCFIAVLSALVSALRGIALIFSLLWKQVGQVPDLPSAPLRENKECERNSSSGPSPCL